MLTGIDLVKEQIRVAAGERLSVTELPPLRGHVIECRVNAEDPARNFQPSPGKILAFHPPGGPGVRLDTHVYDGYTVPPYYDSLLAKLICQGRDRAEALARMHVALDGFIIEGVTTTIPFLARVMQNPRFMAGQVDTKFLERESDLLEEASGVRVDVLFGSASIVPSDVAGKVVAVIDVLRASTSIATALSNGARAVIPLESSDEVVTRAKAFERRDVRLAGERKMLPIPGFELGNSPSEFTRE